MKHYSSTLIFESASGYFVDYITHLYQSDQYFFDNLDKALDIYSTYDKVLIAGDFNAQEGEKSLDTFLYQHELKSLNKEDTCHKNLNKPSCIDLIFFFKFTYKKNKTRIYNILSKYNTIV